MAKRPSGAMHVDKVVSRQADREYVSYLLRQSYREGAKVKKRTLANLSMRPLPAMEALLDPEPSRQRDLVLTMVVGRILQPASKLATTRLLPTTSLGTLLDVED